MPLYDFECEKCGKIHEAVTDWTVNTHECPFCSEPAKRIISLSSVNTANQDAPWIRSIVEVVDKDSNDPVDIAMRENPTRDNYKRWMKVKGLRHLEPGEKLRPNPPDTSKIMKEVLERHMQRNRIELKG